MSDSNINLQCPQDEFYNLPQEGLRDSDSDSENSVVSICDSDVRNIRDGSCPSQMYASWNKQRKTKLCSRYEKGWCRYSKEECNFAHGDSDLICLKSKICEFWKRGYCYKANKCRYAHGKKELGDVFKNVSYPSTSETLHAAAPPNNPHHDANYNHPSVPYQDRQEVTSSPTEQLNINLQGSQSNMKDGVSNLPFEDMQDMDSYSETSVISMWE
eukprot:gene11490-3423_t